jgi:hypothetical protein
LLAALADTPCLKAM